MCIVFCKGQCSTRRLLGHLTAHYRRMLWHWCESIDDDDVARVLDAPISGTKRHA